MQQTGLNLNRSLRNSLLIVRRPRKRVALLWFDMAARLAHVPWHGFQGGLTSPFFTGGGHVLRTLIKGEDIAPSVSALLLVSEIDEFACVSSAWPCLDDVITSRVVLHLSDRCAELLCSVSLTGGGGGSCP